MEKIVAFEQGLEHRVTEIICVKCGYRCICVRPSSVLLKKLECDGCGLIGFCIETGQDLEEQPKGRR